MSLIAYVRKSLKPTPNIYKELSLANLLNTEIGNAVLEINKTLQATDPDLHEMVLEITLKLIQNKPLSQIYNPVEHQEFTFVSTNKDGLITLQSNRLLSLFSDDNGLSWYDIDIKPPFRWFWSYLNKSIFIKPGRIKNLIKKRLLHYVDFPYEQDSSRVGKDEASRL